MLFKAVICLAVFSVALAEVAIHKQCPNVEQADCTVNEVRIDPCPEAASSEPCHIKRQGKSRMTFDFTPYFEADTLDAGLSWLKSDDQELPLITMDREACKSTSCPVKTGVKQTYSIDVPIERKFPTSSYTIKWTLTAPSGKVCCFTTDIKVVRR